MTSAQSGRRRTTRELITQTIPDSEGTWQPIWVRGGKINEVAWVGKEVIAWCSGLHLIFFHVSQKRESLRWCPKAENPDGVCCLSGHPTLQLLAFSDKTFVNPKIRVLSYPSMRKVSECLGGSKTGFFATAFTSADHLVTLAANPTYALTIWAWRTGERLSSIETLIRDTEDQIIRVTPAKPTLIAQLGRPSGSLHVWEVSPAGRTLVLTSYEVALPNEASAYHMDWSSESGENFLAVVDRLGHVFVSNQDGSSVYRVVLTRRCGICLEYEAPAVCWFRGGIILRTTFCQIRFFRRDATNAWRKEWYLKSDLKPCNLITHPSRHDRLFYHTEEGFLMELDLVEGQDDPVIERRMNHGGIYRFADMIHPWGHHLVAMDDSLKVAVLDCYDGRQVARFDLKLDGEVMQLLSHPDFPLTAVTSMKGELALLSLRAPESPFVIARFHLQRERLDLIKFSESGRNLAVGQRTTGICYCVSLTRNKPFTVIARVETKCRMADVVLHDDGGHLKLLVLVVSSRRVPVGRHLAVYDLQPGKRGPVEPTSYLELPGAYQFLHYAPKSPHTVIATVYLSRQIHRLEISDWRQVNLVEAIASGHQVRRAKLSADRRWITSATFDGLVTVRSGKTLKVTATLSTHHRRDLGVVRSFVGSSGDIVVALGHDGSLVTMNFRRQDDASSPDDPASCCRVDFNEYERRSKEIQADYASLDPGVTEMLSRKVPGSPLVENGVGLTWVEASEEATLLEEAERCSDEKQAIQADFIVLQRKVAKLLDENQACPEIERLPTSAFDLDKAARDQKLKTARDDIEDTQLALEFSCVTMDRVAGWIRTTFWDTQGIIGQSIFPIFGNEEVTNFSAITDTPDVQEMQRVARLYWDPQEIEAGEEPVRLPGEESRPASRLQTAAQKQTRFDSADERQRFDALLDDEEDHEVDEEEVEDQLAKEGTTTHRFVEPSSRYSSQFEESGYSQLLLENRNIVIDCQRLRDHFNRLFLEMYESKERELRLIRERHERIRHVDSELRLMFGVSVPEAPVDPVWNSREVPNSILRVLDAEVKAQPYLSSSQRELLNRRAAEAERLRRIMLADDFREKALMRMMDGVLEIRWEDTLKRDVPRPQCMTTKDPEDYSAEDIVAVRQYEKDVEALEKERLRYLRILEAEYAKVSATLQEGIEKFNARLRDFSVLRMRLEAAVHQLNLRNLRGWLRHMRRMRAMREDDEIRVRITAKREVLARLRDEVRLLQRLAREYKNQHDAAVTRERTTERKFRGEFPSLRRVVAEALEKEYKRRPKVALRNSTAGDLVELGRNVAARLRASHLPHECLEYLRHLEALDARPPTLPTTVENHHWEHLTRMRRSRIDAELRLRARMAEVQETERTIGEHNEKIARCQADIDLLVERRNDMRQARVDFDVDVEIQLVLKMGQVEVVPRGRRDDMANAVFIPRREIDAVNETIARAGRKKLAAMDHTIGFRRGLLFKEWEHKCRRATLVDLQEELGMVESLLVTRDVREYLRRHSKGYRDDKTPQQLQRELEAMRRSCEKRLREWLLRLEDVEAKILRVKRQNEAMDGKIQAMNVDRWELEWQRDLDYEAKQQEYHDRRMAVVVRRSRLVRTLQKEFAELLAMQTEHELLRLRRFPALTCFKTLDDEARGKNVG